MATQSTQLVRLGCFFFHYSLATLTTKWVQTFTALLLYAYVEIQQVRSRVFDKGFYKNVPELRRDRERRPPHHPSKRCFDPQPKISLYNPLILKRFKHPTKDETNIKSEPWTIFLIGPKFQRFMIKKAFPAENGVCRLTNIVQSSKLLEAVDTIGNYSTWLFA